MQTSTLTFPAVAWRASGRVNGPISLADLLAGLPGGAPATRAPSPVWRGSAKKPVRFEAMTKRQAVKLWHNARRFERLTRRPGRQDGAIGRNGLAVLHAFLFDFINYGSGRLDPGHAAIARRAGISERSVRRGLAALKAAGVVNWLRRCVSAMRDGRFSLEQETNAYAVLPATQWCGYSPALEPLPEPGTWGDHPALPDPLTAACLDLQAGAGPAAVVPVLNSDPRDTLALALGRLGQAMAAKSADRQS